MATDSANWKELSGFRKGQNGYRLCLFSDMLETSSSGQVGAECRPISVLSPWKQCTECDRLSECRSTDAPRPVSRPLLIGPNGLTRDPQGANGHSCDARPQCQRE